MNEKIIKQEATYDFLKDEVHCLYAEKKELQTRIDKAIVYIENETLSRKLTDRGIVCEIYDVYKLLDILKRSDKE